MNIPPFQPTIDYTSRDYDAIRADMIRLVRARIPQWNAETADFGMALIEAFSYATDIVNYYIDRVASEAYLSTAVQRESLYAIADMFNYTPKTAEAATVSLQFANSTRSSVTVPAGTRCQAAILTSGGTSLRNFETISEVSIGPMEGINLPTSTTVGAVEGRTYTGEALGVSNGFIRQRYLLPRTSVLQRTISVTTQLGESVMEWTPITDLARAAPKDLVFMVVQQTDSSTLIEFGNGTNGFVPPLFSIVRATYRVGGGSGGNVAQGTINTIVEPVIYGLSVTNHSSASGGLDPESIDSIRINAARSFRARDRAVTIPDYEAVTENSPYVAKAKALGNNASSVTVYVVPNDDGTGKPNLSPEEASLIRVYVQERAMAGVTITVVGAAWLDVYIRVQAHNRATTLQSVVTKEVKSRLAKLYGFDNVDFDGWVSSSDILSALSDIDGVQYIEILGIGSGPDKAGIADPAVPYNPSNTIFKTTTVVMVNQEVQYFSPDIHILVEHVGGIG